MKFFPQPKIRLPLWSDDGTVYGEPLLFTEKAPSLLAFAPEEILAIYNSTTGYWFRSGTDYSWRKGDRQIRRPGISRIPCLSERVLYPPVEESVLYPQPGHNAIGGGPHGRNLAFSNYDLFARNQVEVIYRTAESFPIFPVDNRGKLPRSRQAAKLKVAVIGDSISCGFNSSGFLKYPPFQPGYFDQFVEALQDSGHKVEKYNFAVDGSSSGNGLAKLANDFKIFTPDLLVVAFGMNNFLNTVKEYGKSIQEIVLQAKELHPKLEIILVASFPRNPEWYADAPYGPGPEFAAELKNIAAGVPSIAVADVSVAWEFMLTRKRWLDLTGNGVNHPNDFGHRLYATVVTLLFS